MEYRRDIDGLRAVSVIPVILFHAGLQPFSGGFVGVDVFFVISGYLITLVIINEIEEGNFSFSRFYERRARRLLPALFFVLLCCTPLAWIWMLPNQFKEYSQALVAISFFVSNVLFWRMDGYFAPDSETNPLLHTWSLSVEEQFYIFFPVLLLLAWRHGKVTAFYIVIILTLVSFLLSEWGWRISPSATFYLLPTRAWELGAGSICAFIIYNRKPRQEGLLSLLGVILILYSVFFYDNDTPFPSAYTLVPVTGAVLVVLFGSKKGIANWFLSSKYMVGVGLISYSAYLWHQPLMAFARIRSESYPDSSLMLILALTSLGLAYFTWKYVEQPFRKRRQGNGGLTKKQIFGLSLAGTLFFVSLGLHGKFTDGMRYLWESKYPIASLTYEIAEREMSEANNGPRLKRCQFSLLEINVNDLSRLDECQLLHGPGILVIGDSHGIDLFNGLVLNEFSDFILGFVRGGCSPYTNRDICQDQYQTIKKLVNVKGQLFDRVIYTQAGFYLMEKVDDNDELEGRNMISHVSLTDPILISDFKIREDYISETIAFLEQLAAEKEGVDIVWVGPRIEPHIPLKRVVRSGCNSEFRMRPGQQELYEEISNLISRQAKDSLVEYVDQIELVNFSIAKDFINCDSWFWRDGDHWSLTGAKEFTRRMYRQLEG
ncbi:acyltransferase [Halomonas sp. DQ26W]|uniref:acyltransferase family protein n=1 Tax=Halomonas sp. DQ26W TaxID=2282311 RepID=UPI000DF744F7|nr:acyltransferase family protein [Halomonas sp. DQ26W]RDB44279.1 acyltransferase [Halomonas sp. DQ26W]